MGDPGEQVMRIEGLRRLARRFTAEGDLVGAGSSLAEAASEAAAEGLEALACSLEGERLLITGSPAAALGRLMAARRLCPEDERARHLLAEAERALADDKPERKQPALYLCARVGTYRQFARRLPRETDTVIELGSAEGHTTMYLARRAAQVIAVEQASACVERAKLRCARYANITWLELDAFDTAQVLRCAPRADLVFADLGGSTWPSLALRAAAIYQHLYKPRAMVIRNVALNDFAAAITSCEADAPPGHWRDPTA